MGWRTATVALGLALAASIVVGLLGLWPSVHGASLADRREKARIAAAVDDNLDRQRVGGWLASRVRLGYVPHRAIVEVQALKTGRRFCMLVAQDFGRQVDPEDVRLSACDF
jgi:hypothetical protein